MRLTLGAFALVVKPTGVLFGRHLRDGDHVQKAIQLSIAAPIDADGDTAAARARHGCGTALRGEGAGVTVIAEIARVPDETCGDDAGDAVHRDELRADLRADLRGQAF